MLPSSDSGSILSKLYAPVNVEELRIGIQLNVVSVAYQQVAVLSVSKGHYIEAVAEESRKANKILTIVANSRYRNTDILTIGPFHLHDRKARQGFFIAGLDKGGNN